MFALLFICFVYGSYAMNYHDFESTLVSKFDGYESVWSKNYIDCDVDSFVTQDPMLEKFLGINDEYPYVLLKLKDNVTDFDTFVWETSEWNEVSASGDITTKEQINTLRSMNATPKTWTQPEGANDALNLTYAPAVFNDTKVVIVLYYSNESLAAPIAELLVETQDKYPNIEFYCWDLVVADSPQPLKYNPSVGIHNYQVHKDEIIELQQPFTRDTFHQFIEANVAMVQFYESLNTLRGAEQKKIEAKKAEYEKIQQHKKELLEMLDEIKGIPNPLR